MRILGQREYTAAKKVAAEPFTMSDCTTLRSAIATLYYSDRAKGRGAALFRVLAKVEHHTVTSKQGSVRMT